MQAATRRVHGGARRLSLLAALVMLAAATACNGGAGDVPETETQPTSRPAPELSDADLWLKFEGDAVAYDGATAFPDALGGPFEGRIVTANGGTVERVAGPSGGGDRALAFPAKCIQPSGCPRAMVEVLHAPALNPGAADFEYGASVWLAPDQTTTGSNIVQKGRFGSEGGLWKLQVDADTGEPSCVVRTGEVALTVRSGTSIADARWHRVVCRRDVVGLSIRVDDSEDRVQGQTGSVGNESPIRVGSPGVDDQDDQFHGRVDDVFLRIEPA